MPELVQSTRQARRVVGSLRDLIHVRELLRRLECRAQDRALPPDHEQGVVEVVSNLVHEANGSLQAHRVVSGRCHVLHRAE